VAPTGDALVTSLSTTLTALGYTTLPFATESSL
jgi:hypothetical protein